MVFAFHTRSSEHIKQTNNLAKFFDGPYRGEHSNIEGLNIEIENAKIYCRYISEKNWYFSTKYTIVSLNIIKYLSWVKE